ncbi:prepilin-type N-terminal cleavage/methylation domain-containing protein [Candidatus Gottesmanbacteria bacterium]|nr:prepilin-type N-terminal cleavage/methylation domain-containing protein [Candidatus Gottesmanbacteria bacterium]
MKYQIEKKFKNMSPVTCRLSHGFSLMELLVVISIIAVLVTISAVSYTTVNKRSRDTKRKSDIEQLRNALEMYRAENSSYPNVGSGNFSNATNLSINLVSTYISAIPADPKSTQVYRYQATGFTNGIYYGYCLSAQLESEDPSDTCTPDSVNSHNYGVKNP